MFNIPWDTWQRIFKKMAQATKQNSQSQGVLVLLAVEEPDGLLAGPGRTLVFFDHRKKWGFLSVSGAQKNSLLIKDGELENHPWSMYFDVFSNRIFDEKKNGTSYFYPMEGDLISLIHRWLKSPTCTGWWYTYPSEKKYEFVSWDDDIPNWMEIHKIHVPVSTNQLN